MSRPRILINCDFDPGAPGSVFRRQVTLYEPYLASVLEAGGLPLLLPPCEEDVLREYLELADGVLFTGGDDYPPELYGEKPVPEVEKAPTERVATDLELMKLTRAGSKPALGICAGMQLLNVASGGALLQHLPPSLGHKARGPEEDSGHEVELVAGTQLERIYGAARLRVNSSHHQAADPKRIAAGLKVSARAADGTVEGLELAQPDGRFFVFVQWHPERVQDEEQRRTLFKAFVDACRKR
ncbi:MAG TPA: gamma-glutamyl-gamma-aminobutyrate hydrolase family protein [Elusimicrobiota bacterium]|nr:gamma-glutamyl-gamma-aminobutyrate hydrolase family protein [Elusimicrobiota bacterium]